MKGKDKEDKDIKIKETNEEIDKLYEKAGIDISIGKCNQCPNILNKYHRCSNYCWIRYSESKKMQVINYDEDINDPPPPYSEN